MNVKMACRISATFLEKEYWLKDGLESERVACGEGILRKRNVALQPKRVSFRQ
jgi:hypothetical protein